MTAKRDELTKKYEAKAKTVSIKFTSRASVNINKNYYTVEACEERVIPNLNDDSVDIAKERKALWDTVNEECDNQIADIIKMYKNS